MFGSIRLPEESKAPDTSAYALAYAAAGMKVFLVKADKTTITDYEFRLFHGKDDATTDPELIKKWWGKFPFAEIGYAVPPEIIVLDVEARGYRDFEAREGKPTSLIETPQASSPSGGVHLYFDTTGRRYRNRVKFAPEMDTRTGGGYVVLPSPGNGRHWLKPLTTPMLPAPSWIPEDIERPFAPGEQKPFAGENAYGRMLLEKACYDIIQAPYGSQETTCHNMCYWVGGIIAGGYLDYEPTVAVLIETSGQMHAYRGPWTNVARRVRDSVARGMKEPWDGLEDNWQIPDELLTPEQLAGVRLIQTMLSGEAVAQLDQEEDPPLASPIVRPVIQTLKRRSYGRV
jgi:Bifunctional DNA primase/polymerase, N-terminal